MKNFRGYIFSRPFFGERAPQHIQNQIIRDFCEKKEFNYLLSSVEYAVNRSNLMLKKILNELDEVDGIVMYSLFQLPHEESDRNKVYKKIISKKKSIYFAVEDMRLKLNEEINQIENIIKIKEFLPQCINKIS
jgi:sporadic carbohydrate cluster protein (TIGR04323 family)|tara:strand:+ start:317 stop:715 length:399 start_codon:yes stop_codon:yes gene_type:complete